LDKHVAANQPLLLLAPSSEIDAATKLSMLTDVGITVGAHYLSAASSLDRHIFPQLTHQAAHTITGALCEARRDQDRQQRQGGFE
jgi:hypothetical protein